MRHAGQMDIQGSEHLASHQAVKAGADSWLILLKVRRSLSNVVLERHENRSRQLRSGGSRIFLTFSIGGECSPAYLG